jgi:hypothetical protein
LRFHLNVLDICLTFIAAMPIQTPIDYFKMFSDLVERCNERTRQRDEADVEIAKIKQLIIATFPLIPEDKQRLFQAEIDAMDEQSAGLLDAIKLVFSTHKGEWLTTSKVHEHLLGNGFDFRHYRANPMASITTTLKRMVPSLLDSMNSGSGILYKRRLTLGDRIAGYKDVPVHDPSHPIHDAGPIAKVTEANDWKPKYGTPDPLNQRGKKRF